MRIPRPLRIAAFGLAAAAFAGNGAGDTRPAAGKTSPLQARVDAAADGATVEVGPGRYSGDLVLRRPIRLIGRGRPTLVGSGAGSVVSIRAPGVTLRGFVVDGRRGGDLGRDSSGVHVAAENASVLDCEIFDSIFGVYLREANGARVERCRIRGIPDRDAGEKGSGIHVWNTRDFLLAGNSISQARDGFYIQSSHHGVIVGNTARDLRYGLHYMFSDDNRFEDNLFENGAAGAALMYSNRIAFRRNRFLHNRGFASVGLLLKTCDDVLAEDNAIADNARGIFLEGSARNVFRRNLVTESDAAIVLYDSCSENRFEGNAFLQNRTPLTLVGRRTDTNFDGNYWSDNEEPDLDEDGRTDRPYVLSSVFDHLRGNLAAADLVTSGLAAGALSAAERLFPILETLPVADRRPFARPPALRSVPPPPPAPEGRPLSGVLGSTALLAAGAALVRRGIR